MRQLENEYVVFGLGSNQGESLDILRGAVAALRGAVGRDLEISSLYQSAPVGPHQPDFLNAAVQVQTAMAPSLLLQTIQEIEKAFGRVRPYRWAPRTLDVDILWATWTHRTLELTVPHLELCQRRFALEPLLELVPTAVDPLTGLAYRTTAWVQVQHQRIQLISDPSWAQEGSSCKSTS